MRDNNVSSVFQTPKRELEIRRAAEYFFYEIRGVLKWDETLFRVFDIPSRWKQKRRSKRRNKIAKFYAKVAGDIWSMNKFLQKLTEILGII